MVNQKTVLPVTIGVRELKPEQAEQLLPGYKRIAHQIELFRSEAKKIRESIIRTNDSNFSNKQNGYREHYSVDNTISILGSRGSGKTSVMLTFRKEHYEDPKNKEIDIILPLIVPEDMSDANDTLGWFLGYLGHEVDKIDDKYKSARFNSHANNQYDQCLHKERSPLKDRYNRLLKSYITRKDQYYEIIQGKNVGKAEYIKENEAYVHTDQRFGKDFRDFIHQLIETKKQTNPKEGTEPLIMVFFDDVDISAERCPEALETIRKFFSHPNIVIFVSGDYNVFSEAMTIEFMRKEKIEGRLYDKIFTPSDKSSLLTGRSSEQINTALNQRKIRSQDYLKKVLPPSFRFEMKKMGNEDKANFSYQIELEEKNSVQDIILKELIAEISFQNGGTVKDGIIIPYYRIFDENPRGLINPFYFLYQKSQQRDPIWDKTDLVQFFNVLVNSSLRLREYRHDLEKAVQIGLGAQATRIDYKYISNLYEMYNRIQEQEDIAEEEFYEDMITLYLFADFFEILCKRAKLQPFQVVNKTGVLVNILNKPHSGKNMTARIYPNLKHDRALINIYQKLSESISFHNLKDLFTSSKPSLYFEVKYYKTLEDRKLDLMNFFSKTFEQDPEWVTQHINFLFEQGRSFTELIEANIDELLAHNFLSKDIVPKELRSFLYHTSENPEEIESELIRHIEKRSERYQLHNSEKLELIFDEIDSEMWSLERSITDDGPKDNDIDRYKELWEDMITLRIASELKNRENKRNHKSLFEKIILIFDELIEEGKLLSLKRPFSEEHFMLLYQLRDLSPTAMISDRFTKAIYQLREHNYDIDIFRDIVQQIVAVVEREISRRPSIFEENFLERFRHLQSSILQEKADKEEKPSDEIRWGSLAALLIDYASFYIHLKSWVQNQKIIENDELKYFRDIKDKLREKYGNKRTSLSRFEGYIIQKLNH
ncbi:hypothetical protein J1P26_09425 [Neobacillus sp. MM2021_6]|uniref:hypothetical protein n=1 Tax=Bacillaceae TaxID=186817 RepID=UPI00140CEB4B|nr:MULTISPECIES: hypothetical protein [Bacillaceae]MBO0959946.1 hypothetical protein [Neobacillus sp. MM2021_6]NHC18895.1 hypothetical protein [Bacillus sp. MM2020_4]